jgi:hypothetical protein
MGNIVKLHIDIHILPNYNEDLPLRRLKRLPQDAGIAGRVYHGFVMEFILIYQSMLLY